MAIPVTGASPPVVDTDVYDLLVSSRNANQNTGFAFKKGLSVELKPDFVDLNVGSVRRGTRIDLTHNGQTIKLMSIHLKSGCFSNSSASTSNACQKLAGVPDPGLSIATCARALSCRSNRTDR